MSAAQLVIVTPNRSLRNTAGSRMVAEYQERRSTDMVLAALNHVIAVLEERIGKVRKSLTETFAPYNLAALGEAVQALTAQVEALTGEVAALKAEKASKKTAAKTDEAA